MLDLIKLRYKLNKEYFFSSSIVLKDISEVNKKIIFACYSFLKTMFLSVTIIFVEVLLWNKRVEPYLVDIVQLVFFLVCVFYFRNISDSENRKTHIKDFLAGKNFDNDEKIKNKKKIAALFFIEVIVLYFLLWIILIPYISYLSLFKVFLFFTLSIISIVSVFFGNYFSKSQSGSKYWFVQYILVGVISYTIVQLRNYFNQDIKLTSYEISSLFSYLLVCAIIYQIISNLVLFKKDKLQNQKIGGLIGDFIETYLSKSAIVYAVPIVFLNIVSVSQLSKSLIIVAYISLFVMPNVMSLRFLNYYKIIGNSRDILVNYGLMILLFQLILVEISGILCRVSIVNLFLMAVLLSCVTSFRICIAILVAKSKHGDRAKTDYYAISMFVPVMLMFTMAFFWR